MPHATAMHAPHAIGARRTEAVMEAPKAAIVVRHRPVRAVAGVRVHAPGRRFGHRDGVALPPARIAGWARTPTCLHRRWHGKTVRQRHIVPDGEHHERRPRSCSDGSLGQRLSALRAGRPGHRFHTCCPFPRTKQVLPGTQRAALSRAPWSGSRHQSHTPHTGSPSRFWHFFFWRADLAACPLRFAVMVVQVKSG